MKRTGLILNKSYNDFILGTSITNYMNMPHRIACLNDPQLSMDLYAFFQDGIEYGIWCEDNLIESIRCDESCIYNGQELINMKYEDFLCLIDDVPDDTDVVYVPVTADRGQNQHVYTFDKSGLQVWVWRNRIRTVIIKNFED